MAGRAGAGLQRLVISWQVEAVDYQAVSGHMWPGRAPAQGNCDTGTVGTPYTRVGGDTG